jgi:hypothetical protein
MPDSKANFDLEHIDRFKVQISGGFRNTEVASKDSALLKTKIRGRM